MTTSTGVTKDYETNTRGHIWETNEYGQVDVFAFDVGHHNGPRCVNCGYSFCHHCHDGPEVECPKGEKSYE